MAERDHPSIKATGKWAFEELGKRIGHSSERIYEPWHGEGVLFVSPPEPDQPPLHTITLFEQEQAVHIRTPEVRIEIANAAPPVPTRDGIRIDTKNSTARALFLRDGHIAVEVFPHPKAEPLEPSPIADEPEDAAFPDSPPISSPSGSGDVVGASAEATATDQSVQKESRQAKVKWTGYVAADPLFATSSDGTPRVNLIVSEHLEDDQTIYHKVYSTKREAARLKDLGIAKGNRVRVEGYVQNRERQNRDGTTTPETRVYSVHMKVYSEGSSNASDSDAG